MKLFTAKDALGDTQPITSRPELGQVGTHAMVYVGTGRYLGYVADEMNMGLHELATNAAKYGALSRAGGKLAVSWTIDSGGACDIAWCESGGPTVRPPSRSGFGSVLIERSIPFDLGGSSTLEFRPEGLHGYFKIPGKHLTQLETADTAAPLMAPAMPPMP